MEKYLKWMGMVDATVTLTAMALIAKHMGAKHPFLTVMVEARLLQYLKDVCTDEDCGIHTWISD